MKLNERISSGAGEQWSRRGGLYMWPAGKDIVTASFIDGRLYKALGAIVDRFPFDPYEAQRADFLRRWRNIHRQEME
jgi:hypothetical protein